MKGSSLYIIRNRGFEMNVYLDGWMDGWIDGWMDGKKGLLVYLFV